MTTAPTTKATAADKTARIQALLGDYLNLEKAQKDELDRLVNEVKADKAKRSGDVQALKEKIAELNPSLTELFATDELKAMVLEAKYQPSDLFTAAQLGGKVKGTKAPKAEGTGATRTAHPYPSNNDIALFDFPKTGKRGDQPHTYHRGRISETYKEQANKPPYFPAAPAKLQAHGTKVAELMKFLPTDADKRKQAVDYLSTPKGAEEVAKLVSFVSGTEVKAEAVAKEIAAAVSPAAKAPAADAKKPADKQTAKAAA